MKDKKTKIESLICKWYEAQVQKSDIHLMDKYLDNLIERIIEAVEHD